MSYDLGGGIWGKAPSHNTPLNRIDTMISDNFTKKGFPKEKISIGLANYGFIYDGLNPGVKTQEKLSAYGRYFSYNELDELLKSGWKEVFDQEARSSYYFSPDNSKFVTVDNHNSISEKMKLIKSNGFNSCFWWEYHCDLVEGRGNEKWQNLLIDHAISLTSK